MKNQIIAAFIVLIMAYSIAIAMPVMAGKPSLNIGHYPAAMDWKKGAVTGTLGTVYLGTGDASGAYIAIVNAANVSEEYYNTTSDAKGSFRFTGVNATYSSRLGRGSPAFGGNYTQGTNAYRIYANMGRYGEGYSAPFGIDEDNTSAIPVVVHTGPARVALKAEKTHVMCDDYDNIRIIAYVYDALDNPVSDGCQVNFSVGDGTGNAYDGGFNWSRDNGSFSASPGNGTFTSATLGGSTSAQFGWLHRGFGGNNSTIWAYVNGTDLHSTINIYFADYSASWTGYVVDSSGTGLEGIPVTVHVMGMGGTVPYELYNVTRMTSSRPYAGLFAVDYIPMNYVAYCYADTSICIMNRTIYGRSKNFAMNRSEAAIAIVLDIPPAASPAASPVASPPAAAKPAPGFEVLLAPAGLLGAACLAARK